MLATLERLFAGSSGRCYLLNAGGNLLEEVGAWGVPPANTGATIDPANCWALRRGHPHARGFGDSINPPCHYLGTGERPYICIPLQAQGTVLGIIHLLVDGADSQPERRERTQHLAVAAADSISLALANLRLRQSLHALSIRDPLTGLYNRRFMEESLERELMRMTRIDKPLGVAIFDIDFFKPNSLCSAMFSVPQQPLQDSPPSTRGRARSCTSSAWSPPGLTMPSPRGPGPESAAAAQCRSLERKASTCSRSKRVDHLAICLRVTLSVIG